jgi:DNA-binding PadR family transcriptional regulator
MSLPSRPRSPLTIVVLALTCEEPMHPYRMQTLITQRGKDEIANVTQRNSVYQTIDSLRKAGLIAIRETSQDSRRPERTIYEATEQGRLVLRSWVRTGLSTLAREFPEFPAVLATLYGVEGPADLAILLGARIEALKTRLTALERPVPGVPRLFLLENEYMAAVVRAECKWLREIAADLQSGRLDFPTEAEMLQIATHLGGPSAEAVRNYAKEVHASSSARTLKPRAAGAVLPSKPGEVSATPAKKAPKQPRARKSSARKTKTSRPR